MSRVRFIVRLPPRLCYLLYYLACRYHVPDPTSDNAKAEVIQVSMAVMIGFREIRQSGNSVKVVSRDNRVLGSLELDLRRLVLEKKHQIIAMKLEVGAQTAAEIYEIAQLYKLDNNEDLDDKSKAVALSLYVLEEWDEQLRRGNKICIVDSANNIIDPLELPIPDSNTGPTAA